MDEEGRLKNLSWCPAECFDWYQMYGDVVIESTYKGQRSLKGQKIGDEPLPQLLHAKDKGHQLLHPLFGVYPWS